MTMNLHAPPALQLGSCRPSTELGPPLRRPVQSQLPARFRFVPREKGSPPPRSISPSNPPAGQQSKIRRTIREGYSVREPCTGRQNLLPDPGSWAARFPNQHSLTQKDPLRLRHRGLLHFSPFFPYAPAFEQLVHSDEPTTPPKAPHSPFQSTFHPLPGTPRQSRGEAHQPPRQLHTNIHTRGLGSRRPFLDRGHT